MVRSRVMAAMLLAGFCLSAVSWAQSPKELRQLKEEEIAKIKEAVDAKKLAGIAAVDDFSDMESGLRLVIEIKNGFHPEAILEQLYQLTPMKAACLLAILAASLLIAGCERTFRDMYDQPKRGPMQPSPLFDNGMSSRPPPAGAVPAQPGRPAPGMPSGGVPGTGAPRSLGLVSPRQVTTVERSGLRRDVAAYAVSLEPAGGSPTGQPTGPILALGKLQG